MTNGSNNVMMLQSELLHVMSVAIGAAYVSVEDGARRLGVAATKLDTPSEKLQSLFHSGEWFEHYLVRHPKWMLNRNDLQAVFAKATGVAQVDLSAAAKHFRVDVWAIDHVPATTVSL